MKVNPHNLLSVSQSVSQSVSRAPYLDIAKGIAIILVVLGHTDGYIIDRPALQGMGIAEVTQLRILCSVIYGFHMPLFFFIAGIFADRSLRHPAGAFLKKRLIRYALPYFAWTFITVSIKMLTSSLQRTSAGFHDLLMSPFVPYRQYWFLHSLFFFSVAYYFVMKAGKSSRNVKFALLAVSVVIRFLYPLLPDVWIISKFSFMFYYVLGSYFDYVNLPKKIMANKFAPLALGGGFALLNVLYVISGLYDLFDINDYPDLLESWYKIPLSLVGIAAIIALSYCLSAVHTAFTRLLVFCGLYSMQIYCSHQIPMGGIDLFVRHFTGDNYLWARTLLQTSATMALCCIMVYFWPNDSHLHLVLFGEPHVKSKARSVKQVGSNS